MKFLLPGIRSLCLCLRRGQRFIIAVAMTGENKFKDIKNIKSPPAGTSGGGWKSNLDDPTVGESEHPKIVS